MPVKEYDPPQDNHPRVNYDALVEPLPGAMHRFYSEMQEEYLPEEQRLRRFTGKPVTIIAKLENEFECEETSAMYLVRAEDGTEFAAWWEELSGWDYQLDQFFWPDGTFGKNRDETFLVNERS